MKLRLLLVAAVGLLALIVPVYAHHSFAATYQEDKTISVEGKIVQFQFRNPHSFVQILDSKGARWALEWGGAAQLGGQGVTRESLKAGDVITVTGSPGRNLSDNRVRMKTLFRKSDGFGWGTKDGEVFD
jgi:hypothetical protein